MSLYVFGSYASGKSHENSDLDVLLVSPDNVNPSEMSVNFSLGLFPRNYDLEVLSCTASELQKKIKNNAFYANIIKQGKLIYGFATK